MTEERALSLDGSSGRSYSGTGPESQILLFIAHQDEDKTMRELGLLKGAEEPS